MFGRAGVKFFGLHHVGNVERAFPVKDGSLRVLLAFAHVLFGHTRAFDNDLLFLAEHRNDAAALAFVRAGSDDNLVAFFDVKSTHGEVEKLLQGSLSRNCR